MKIVDVSGFYAPTGGGVRRYVEEKFAAAGRHGHDLTVIAPGKETRVEPRAGGRVHWVASPAMPFDAAYRRFDRAAPVWRILDEIAPDIVEGSSPWRGGRIAARWPGPAPRAFVFHQDFVAAYAHTALDQFLARERIDALFAPWWARLRAMSEAYDVTVTAGEWLARRLAGFGLERTIAIPLGIEAHRFSPARRDEALRVELLARCGAVSHGKLLICVGRFHPEKRHRVVIEGFARARALSPWPLGLVLIGDGLTRRRVERLARRAGGVILLGAIEDRERLARLYASADALVHGSAAETYGLAVAEAMASGLPVVAPAAGGAADLAAAGPSRLYPPGDAPAMAAAIVDILTTPGERKAVKLPTSASHFEALFSLYEDLLARPRVGRGAG
jgi:alpha-1,6-mannosyltransferase